MGDVDDVVALEAAEDGLGVLVDPDARLVGGSDALLDEALEADGRGAHAARLRDDDNVALADAEACVGDDAAVLLPFGAQRAVDAAYAHGDQVGLVLAEELAAYGDLGARVALLGRYASDQRFRHSSLSPQPQPQRRHTQQQLSSLSLFNRRRQE